MKALLGRGLRVAIAATAVPYSFWLWREASAQGRPLQVLVLFWSYLICGLVVWERRPHNRIGPLMVVLGHAWMLWLWYLAPNPVLLTIGNLLIEQTSTLQVWLYLAIPTGRLGARSDGAIVLLFAVIGTAFGILEALGVDPSIACGRCTSSDNLLLVGKGFSFEELSRLYNIAYFVGLPLFLLTIFRLARRLSRATPARRWTMWPALVPAITAMALIGLTRGLSIFFVGVSGLLRVEVVLENVAAWLLALLPLGVLFGVLRQQARRARAGGLVVELANLPSHGRLRETVARALGDPTVRVGYWSGAEFFAEDLSLVEPGAGRAAILLERRGEPLAVIEHDDALLDDPGLIEVVRSAALLALENEWLESELAGQLEEVQRSRRRIIEAADEQRRRIERNIHDGAQQRLATLALAVRFVRSKLDGSIDPEAKRTLSQVSEDLAKALAELRELARGAYPAILTDEGLIAAVEALVVRSPVPTELHAGPVRRLPSAIEAAAYFVVSEALANVAKHARASRAAVTVRLTGDNLLVAITDDGVGGADLNSGSGLRGLSDRVQALSGELSVATPAGGGTSVTARIPLPAADRHGAST